MLKWPDEKTVAQALTEWARGAAQTNEELDRVGYFGSYAQGVWGVGSDVDIVVVVRRSELPFERRGSQFSALDLPVPADVFVYTIKEWDSEAGFIGMACRHTRWVYVKNDGETSLG